MEGFNLLIIGKNEQNKYETYFNYSDVVERNFIKSDVDEKFRIKGFCLPKESEYFALSVVINSKNGGKGTLKDVKVELFKWTNCNIFKSARKSLYNFKNYTGFYIASYATRRFLKLLLKYRFQRLG